MQVAVNIALLAVGGYVILNEGAVVYPEPLLTISTDLTDVELVGNGVIVNLGGLFGEYTAVE